MIKHILLDLDGVFADFTWSFTETAFHLGVASHAWHCKDQKTWRFEFNADKVWREVDRTPNWWMRLEPMVTPEEVSRLNSLMDDHLFTFVTNRQDSPIGMSVEDQSEAWLEKIGVNMSLASVLSVKGPKSEAAKELGIDLAIDDSPRNIQDFKDAGITVVTRAWQYNEGFEPRVDSLMQFLEEYVDQPLRASA